LATLKNGGALKGHATETISLWYIDADTAAKTESPRIQLNALEKSILTTTKLTGMLVRKWRVAWTAVSQPLDTPTQSWEAVKPSNKT